MVWSKVQLPGAQHLQYGVDGLVEGLARQRQEAQQDQAMDQQGALQAQGQGMDAMQTLARMAADKDSMREQWRNQQQSAADARTASAGQGVLDRAADMAREEARNKAEMERAKMHEEHADSRWGTRQTEETTRHGQTMARPRSTGGGHGGGTKDQLLEWTKERDRMVGQKEKAIAQLRAAYVKPGEAETRFDTILHELNTKIESFTKKPAPAGGGGTPPPGGKPPPAGSSAKSHTQNMMDTANMLPDGKGGMRKKNRLELMAEAAEQ